MSSTAAKLPPVAASTRPLQIALAGNPNTGKSALFNRLTGARQRVGNYPGLTVEKKVGITTVGESQVEVIDLPGLYSLAAISLDERVVRDVLSGNIPGTRVPDLVVYVADACNLLRNLFLASQIAQTKLPMVIALNMCDEAQSKGINIDVEVLSQRLGVPVVKTVASRGQGLAELRTAIENGLENKQPMNDVPWPEPVTQAMAQLRKGLADAGTTDVSECELFRLLVDVEAPNAVRMPLPQAHVDKLVSAARDHLKQAKLDPVQFEATLRYRWITKMLDGVVALPSRIKLGKSESVDAVLTHRVLGLAVFVGIMYFVFLSIYKLAQPAMDGIDWAFGSLGEVVGGWLTASPMLQSLLVDGAIAGVGGVVIFLPQILILFFFIAFLEDSGYMARAAFLMDKLFSWCGLNGKSFVPMLSSYACAVPGVMATRTIDDPKARLTTILIAPLMSCSARLPVYVLLIGAFIEPRYGAWWAGAVLLGMHFLGLAVAMPVAFLINRVLLRGRAVPFVLELPPYRVPQLRDVFWRMYERGREFMLRAGTVIFAMSIVIWALCYFPRPAEVGQHTQDQYVQQIANQQNISVEDATQLVAEDEQLSQQLDGRIGSAYLEQSWMGRMGKTVQPIFAPAGFDWKITVGVLASFPAREVIISTLGIIYDLGGEADEESESLIARMQSSKWEDGRSVYNPIVALSIMVFFALCMQCGSTMAIMARESSWRWATLAFAYMTFLAWLGAVVVYQAGTAMLPMLS